jgi:uncharacterized repeat protein (TIGR01451 family)
VLSLSKHVWVQKLSTPDVVPWQPGQAITYTLTYGNAGDALAPGVVLTDTLPPEIVGPGWTASDPALC